MSASLWLYPAVVIQRANKAGQPYRTSTLPLFNSHKDYITTEANGRKLPILYLLAANSQISNAVFSTQHHSLLIQPRDIFESPHETHRAKSAKWQEVRGGVFPPREVC
jgi:hypothetical protein